MAVHQGTEGHPSPISCETTPKWHGFLMNKLAETVNRLEHRTSNVQHRTLNIDDATLYRFYNKRTAEIRRVDSLLTFVATSAE